MSPFSIYMLLIVMEGRWTARPAISRDGMKGYGFEIPIDSGQTEVFTGELREGELQRHMTTSIASTSV